MSKPTKERMRDYRLRLKNNTPFIPKHEPSIIRTRKYRTNGGKELRKKRSDKKSITENKNKRNYHITLWE